MATLGAVLGCGGDSSQGVPAQFAALAPATAFTTLLRLPSEGGTPTLYVPRALTEIPWPRAPEPLPALRKPVGADLDQRLVFALDRGKEIVGLDLETGKVRTFVTDAVDAFVGPDGTLFALGSDSSVTELHRRTPVAWGSRLAWHPKTWFGSSSRELMAVSAADPPELAILHADGDPLTVSLPHGPAVATPWGDLLAIAADTALVLFAPKSDDPFYVIDIPGSAQTVSFSPAGHRLYVGGNTPRLLVVDRYGEKVLRRIALPGTPATLRSSLHGGWLLARPETGDSIWVVDVTEGRTLGVVPGAWGDDLPIVIGDVLVLRQGADVIAIDLAGDGMPEMARLRAAATDLFLPLGWSPSDESGAPQLVAGADTGKAASEANIYLQVSSSQNPKWAEDFASRLIGAGLAASVLPPRPDEEGYRVVIGPYLTRDEADSVGRELGVPYFIYQPRTP